MGGCSSVEDDVAELGRQFCGRSALSLDERAQRQQVAWPCVGAQKHVHVLEVTYERPERRTTTRARVTHHAHVLHISHADSFTRRIITIIVIIIGPTDDSDVIR